MTETHGISQKDKFLFFAIAVLAVTAAGFGIFGHVYKEIPWLKVQIIGQDAFTILAALFLCILSFTRNRKVVFIQGGILVYLVYTYVFYAFGVEFNPLFLLYVALASLSVWGLIKTAHKVSALKLKAAGGKTPNFAGGYLLFVCLMLGFLWIGDIIGRYTGAPLLENPTGEPLTPVYILDLGFVIPVTVYGAVLTLMKKNRGFIITAVMLPAFAAMGFALMAMALGLFAYNLPGDVFLTGFWFALGTAGLILAGIYLKEMQFEQNDLDNQDNKG
jgi:hypothetical protein